MRLRLPPFLFLIALLVAPLASSANDARLAYLTRQLKTAKDARVRAQSALVIAKMEEPSTVPALCDGLEDESEVVRTAVARALEQMGEFDALPCLKKHARHSDAETRTAVMRAISSLEEIKNRKPLLYISLRPLKVSGGALTSDVLALADKTLRKQLNRRGALLAPATESKSAAKGVLRAKKLKGYLLMPELEQVGANGLRIRMLCLTYPEQSILGEVDVKAAGGKPADLIRALAPRVVDEAAQIIESTED